MKVIDDEGNKGNEGKCIVDRCIGVLEFEVEVNNNLLTAHDTISRSRALVLELQKYNVC